VSETLPLRFDDPSAIMARVAPNGGGIASGSKAVVSLLLRLGLRRERSGGVGVCPEAGREKDGL
jgi:hypothetical protein